MEEKNILGKSVIVKTVATKQEDGTWRVKQVVTHARTLDLETWEEASIEAEALGNEIGDALVEAGESIESYMKMVNYNLLDDSPARNAQWN